MPSRDQVSANKANAKRSTGPRTNAGRKRSSLNAVRHGLTGLLGDEFAPELSELARAIAPRASADIAAAAARVAQAALEVRRARVTRVMAITEALLSPAMLAPKPPRGLTPNLLRRMQEASPEMREFAHELVASLAPPETEEGKLAAALERSSAQLGRLIRYEQRARSRLKRAIREFDALSTRLDR